MSRTLPSLNLPIEPLLSPLADALANNPTAVLQAPPGSGKTTLVPLALLDEPWLTGKRIIMLEPRRLAARAAANRMASLLDESVGETVGYQVRFERKISRRTRIEVVTEGILTRRLQEDPELEGVGLVIFDEFHERHLDGDLGLALCLDVQDSLREDLRLLLMSATLDMKSIARHLGDPPVLIGEGRSFPVDITYLERESDLRPAPLVSQAINKAIATHPEGDVLAFLPGSADIRYTADLLRDSLPAGISIHPLYGDLPRAAQDAAIRPAREGRKVVLATPIAESSLTIQGVRIVVDSGLMRAPRFDPNTGLSRLTTQRISRASTDQRAGRAGREGPGFCYRLWTESNHRSLAAATEPELRHADLAPLSLELAHWGVKDATELRWPEPPPRGSLAQARDLLLDLDGVSADGRITTTGKRMATFPIHPRLAHMLVRADEWKQSEIAIDLAALLGERNVIPPRENAGADIGLRLDLLRRFRRDGRRSIRHSGVDEQALRRADQVAHQLARKLKTAPGTEDVDHHYIGLLLALAYPDRVAQQRPGKPLAYRLVNGRGVSLREDEPLQGEPWLVAAHLDAGRGEGLVYQAASLSKQALEDVLGDRITEHESVEWDPKQAAIKSARERRLGALIVDSEPLKNTPPEAALSAMLEGVRSLGTEALPWTKEARSLQARIESLRHWQPQSDWPACDDAALLAQADAVFGPWLAGITRQDHLKKLDMQDVLKAHLGWQRLQDLDRLAPERIPVPSGSSIRLQYQAGSSPILAVRLQELFGLLDTPTVADGQVPVLVHLLSPAQRPIQVTRDLRGFWRNTYSEVKKELKGRYPKHYWPDDPFTAEATRRVRPRSE